MKQESGQARCLPAERAFVVQFYAGEEPSEGDVAGRVEHVVSGRATHFHSPEELLGFMAHVLHARHVEH
ncbi:MAG: hypothetical protein HYZ72_01350 [Deltaproteobacteria bacterium]|nr:hypothetical protein [Deltaproteobacteria bacterium]